MNPSQSAARRPVWRHGLLLVVLALIVLTLWVVPAQMQERRDPPPELYPICGFPQFQPGAALLRQSVSWKPLSQEALLAQGKLNQQGEVVPDVVGEEREFWASDFSVDPSSFYTLTATCKGVGTHAYVYVENTQTISDTVVTDILDEFDNTIYITDTLTFGSEPDVDVDEHVYLLLLDIQDGYSGPGSYVAGYFYALNEFTNAELAPWPEYAGHSNEKEMVYLDIVQGDPESRPDDFYGVTAHEFEHMIHWWMDNEGDEETWVDEGCADLAGYLCGYGHPRSHLWSDYPSSNPGFLQEPDHQLTLTGPDWNNDPHVLASYGAAYMWTLYLWEHYGGDAIIQKLVDEDANGIEGVNNALAAASQTDDFQAAFRKWVVANYLDDGTGDYGYDSIGLLASGPYDYSTSFPRPLLATTHSGYPVIAAPGDVEYWAADAIKLAGLGGQDLNLAFNGANDNQFSATVVRSTSANLDPGTNTVSDIVLNGYWDGSREVAGSGTQAVLLIPASLSDSGSYGYTYSASLGDAPLYAHSGFLPLVLRPAPTPTPTPIPGPKPGFWSTYGGSITFYVTPDRHYVRNYTVYIIVPGCGDLETHVTKTANVPITNDHFSFSGAFSGSGTFTSSSTASVVAQLSNYNIPGCGNVFGGPWSHVAYWINSTQPNVSDVGQDGDLVVPATTPVPGAAFTVELSGAE